MTWDFDEELERRRNLLAENGWNSVCLFCMTGEEIRNAKNLNKLHEECLFLPFLQTKHKSKDGVKTTYNDALLPGYLFGYLPLDYDPQLLLDAPHQFRILEKKEGDRILKGEDRQYSQLVFDSGGILGMSRAYREGDKVRVVSGPLVTLQGKIVEYSKKNRNCRVEIELFNRKISAWLPFQWITPDNEKK